MTPIEALLAEQQCLKLMTQYNISLDDNDHDTFLSLFTDDAIWLQTSAPTTELRGRKGIRKFLEYRGTDHVFRHLLQNPVVTVLGPDDALGYCIGLVIDGPANGGVFPVPVNGVELVCEYRDTYRQFPEGWKFTRREMTRILDRKAAPIEGSPTA